MGENSVHYGNHPIVESPILARNHRNENETAIPAKSDKKIITDYFHKANRDSNRHQDQRISHLNRGAETAQQETVDYSRLHHILSILRACWEDLIASIAPISTPSLDPAEYKQNRISLEISNQITKPMNKNSKLDEIQSAFQKITVNRSRKRLMELKELIDEECNTIKGLCEQCCKYYDEAAPKLKLNIQTSNYGPNPWEKIKHNAATARNDMKLLFQTVVRSEGMEGSFPFTNDTTDIASTKTIEEGQTSYNRTSLETMTKSTSLPILGDASRNHKENHHTDRLMHQTSSISDLPRNERKNTLKRRRSSSPEITEQRRKRSKSVVPFKFQSVDSFASTTATNTHSAATATSIDPVVVPGVIPKVNRNSHRSRKVASVHREMDDGFTKFSRSFRIEDDDPRRLNNPLLELPQYPGQSRPEVMPQASELLTYMTLFFPPPDTYPVSYYARLLGFDVPSSMASCDNDNFVNIDAETLPLRDRTKDPWYYMPNPVIPVLNNFSNPSNSLEDERRLDLLDPVLKKLLEDLMLSHSNLFIETSQTTTISSDCVAFAREQGLISDDIEFRPFKNGDEAFLSSGDDMIRPGNHVFDPFVRSQGNNIIQAISKSRNVSVGFIRYSFVWYKMSRSTKSQALDKEEGTSYGPNTSELIIRIKNLKGESFLEKCKSSYALVLLALALEHARRLHVWYGILDATNAECTSFFSRYFRMKHVHASINGNVEISEHTMFFNLHRLNYNYSMTHWVEYQDQSLPMDYSISHRERMIVALRQSLDFANHYSRPDIVPRESYRCGPGENLHRDVTVRIKYDRNGEKMDNNTDVSIKCVKDSTDISADERVDPTQSSIDRSIFQSTVNEQLNGNDVSRTYPSTASCLSWKVLKCFPISYNFEATLDEQPINQCDDFVQQQLIQKQKDLNDLETSMVPTLRNLLGSVIKERSNFECNESTKRKRESYAIVQYESLMRRRREVTMAKDSQLEIDMDAVCDVCHDGDVIPSNQIIFCDSCNVAVHQNCYGISAVPDGDFFCDACKYFECSQQPQPNLGEKKPPPIVCELCPSRGGAFYRCHQQCVQEDGKNNSVTKWAHVVCAKWQGIDFFSKNEKVLEDLTESKRQFLGLSCCICLGERGTYNKCRHESCSHWMHVTCARASGSCNVNHGENHLGPTDVNAWTLSCPKHSKLDPKIVINFDTIQKLRSAAQSFPPEPKDFLSMTYEEREKYLEDVENEKSLFESVINRPMCKRCEVCDSFLSGDDNLLTCASCNLSFHGDCHSGWTEGNSDDGKSIVKCEACMYITKNKHTANFEQPRCHMCPCANGLLVKGFAEFQGKKSSWKTNKGLWKPDYFRSLFGKQIWCHAVCAMWHDLVTINNGVADCTQVIMGDGLNHIKSNTLCQLCGRNDKVKVECRTCRLNFHATCARQAGFSFTDGNADDGSHQFSIYCERHGDYENKFRSLLRTILKWNRGKTYDDIAVIYDSGTTLLRNLGWAWAWTDRWVGKNEERLKDARKCRLAAVGAALRNRDYDNEPGDDHVPLINAFKSIMRARSLVGVYKPQEVDILSTWLARIYRTKSPLLALGKDSIPVATEYEKNSPVFTSSKLPRYLLGERILPGKTTSDALTNDHRYDMEVSYVSPCKTLINGKSFGDKKSSRTLSFSPRDTSNKKIRSTVDQAQIRSSTRLIDDECFSSQEGSRNIRVSIFCCDREWDSDPQDAVVKNSEWSGLSINVASPMVKRSNIKVASNGHATDLENSSTSDLSHGRLAGSLEKKYAKRHANKDRKVINFASPLEKSSLNKKRLKSVSLCKVTKKKGRPKRTQAESAPSHNGNDSLPGIESGDCGLERNDRERVVTEASTEGISFDADDTNLIDMDKPIPKKKMLHKM